ncbi:hypothetical protein QBC41DRAFT_382911 [Cercophora samala]|uniref:Uncharacterized protein n=1 Tax=Cercophora samala TaxID=330535 RepID=A0AA39YZU0_9PEZI|nr:hypothetical protein QBC41DRAFT_382911 [Cercophora samala]
MLFTTLPRQLFFLLLLAVSVRISISAKCYYMDEEETTTLTQCSNDANPKLGSTLCCMPGDRCMVNSLCLRNLEVGNIHYYRGGCTIKDWKGKSLSDCPPKHCLPTPRLAEMFPCNTSNSDTGFLCELADPADPPHDCLALEGGLEDFLGTAIPLPSPSTSVKTSTSAAKPTETEGKGDPVRTSQDTADTSPAPTATGSTDTPNVPVTTATDDPTRGSDISVSTASGEPTAAPPPPSPDEPRQDNSSVPVGVGIGVGLAVAIAGGFLVFFYIRKRQREAPIRAETPPPLDPSIQKPDDNYYPFAPYPSAAQQQGSLSNRKDDYFRQPKIPNVTDAVAAPREDNVYPGQPRYQPPKQQAFSHELP